MKKENKFDVEIDIDKDIKWVSEEAKQEFIEWMKQDAEDLKDL